MTKFDCISTDISCLNHQFDFSFVRHDHSGDESHGEFSSLVICLHLEREFHFRLLYFSDAPKARPKLQLQPRSKPLEGSTNQSTAASSAIFGGAKPVDTASKEREIEERLAREREAERERLEDSRRGPPAERSRSRQDSVDSDGGEGGRGSTSSSRRERKSSSSSTKGIRTVAPPPGVGSARIRGDSLRDDDHEEVFDEDKSHSKTTPSAKKVRKQNYLKLGWC